MLRRSIIITAVGAVTLGAALPVLAPIVTIMAQILGRMRLEFLSLNRLCEGPSCQS